MPRVSVWFVRASLAHLVFGVTVGAVLLADLGLGGPGAAWLGALRPAHIESLLFGWVVQLVMGVALWIFPRFGVPRAPRGHPFVAWTAFALLNAGVALVAVAPLLPHRDAPLLAGRLTEIAAAAAFVVNLWGRVRPSGLSEM